MAEFAVPLTIGETQAALDADEMNAGYIAAQRGASEPVASWFSRSFWYGWHLARSDMADDDGTPREATYVVCAYVGDQLVHLQGLRQ